MSPITNSARNNGTALIELGKKASAYRAIDENVDQNVKIIGIGSGSTIVYAIERLAELVVKNNLNIQFIPSSYQSKQLLIKHNLKLTDLEMHQNTDLTIDGADEIDAKLDCIKGGGGCHLQEKLIAYCAKKFVLIADSRKKSFKLGENWPYGVPIEVLPSAYKIIQLAIEKRYGGKSILRESSVPRTKAGPVITDNGNFIIDWIFENNDEETYDWKSVNTFIKMIPGVIETGLFIEMAHLAYFGMEDGTVTVLKRK